MLLLPVIALVIFGVWYFTPVKSLFVSRAQVATPAAPQGRLSSVYTSAVEAKVLLQQPIDKVPEGPLMMRVTELEMEPGSKVFEHRQLGPGAHMVLDGSITLTDTTSRQPQTFRAGNVFYLGMDPYHEAVNNEPIMNHLVQVELLPQSRGFDGTQQFTDKGKHNEGEIRSGPYVQVPLNSLPNVPLMFRVTELSFGSKAKTVEHSREGPALFYVTQGTATVRKEDQLQIITYGLNGYFYEQGAEPYKLENKPAAPMRMLMAEILPASLGDGPSTRPTGRN